MKNIIEKSYFLLNEKILGQNKRIKVKFPNGEEWIYHHDAVYDLCLKGFMDPTKNRSSFKEKGKWTSSYGITKWIYEAAQPAFISLKTL
jgi:hypothetical protein